MAKGESKTKETGIRVVKSAVKGGRAVATIVFGGLAMAFGPKERK